MGLSLRAWFEVWSKVQASCCSVQAGSCARGWPGRHSSAYCLAQSTRICFPQLMVTACRNRALSPAELLQHQRGPKFGAQARSDRMRGLSSLLQAVFGLHRIGQALGAGWPPLTNNRGLWSPVLSKPATVISTALIFHK